MWWSRVFRRARRTAARVPEAITISATDQSDARIFRQAGRAVNFGKCVDLFAPGDAIVSAGITSDTASATLNGSSQAAPPPCTWLAIQAPHRHRSRTP